MISEKAKIAVGTIYTYFKSKEDILDQIFQTEYNKRVEYLESIQTVSISHIDKLHLFLDFHFSELSKNENLSTVLIRESTNPELQHLEGVQKFIYQLPNFFKVILIDALDAGEIRQLNPSSTAEIIFSTIRGTVLNLNLRKDDSDIKAIKQELKDFITYAIKKI